MSAISRLCALFLATLPLYCAEPATYSATAVTSQPRGPITTMKIYRDGPLVMVERSSSLPFPAHGAISPTYRTRVYYNTDTRRWFSTDMNRGPSISANLPVSVSPNCRAGTFDGNLSDDPFVKSSRLIATINQRQPNEIGSTTLNGLPTKILETAPTGKDEMKIWLDTTQDLVVRADVAGHTVFEIKHFSLDKPKPSLFNVPFYCSYVPH